MAKAKRTKKQVKNFNKHRQPVHVGRVHGSYVGSAPSYPFDFNPETLARDLKTVMELLKGRASSL